MLEYSMITKERLEQNEIISRLFLLKFILNLKQKKSFLSNIYNF